MIYRIAYLFRSLFTGRKRKIITIILIILFSVSFANSCQAAEYTVDSTVTPPDWCKGLVQQHIFSDYVVWRNDYYTYCAIGNLDNNLEGDVVIYRYYSRNGNYVYDSYDDSNFKLQPRDYIVYSNVGSYPALIGVKNYEMQLLLFIVCIVVIGFVLRSWIFR